MSSFHTQGAIPLTSNAYVEREFEQNVLQNIFNSRWVLVLGPRQHGKSTGLIRVNQRLIESGFLSAFVDLQGFAINQIQTYQEFLGIFAKQVAKRLEVPVQNLPTGSDANQLIYWLEKIIPQGGQPVVIIIDEASSIPNDEWRNSFYGHIRSLKNEQAIAKPEDLVSRLRFVFSGCFRPDSLVETLNSPFNTCEEVSTDDLDYAQALELYSKVIGKTNEKLVQAVFNIVGGQPYLLQFVFDQIDAGPKSEEEASFKKAIELLFSGQDNHVQFLFQRVNEDESLKELVLDMVKNSSIANDPADANSKFLRTVGLTKLEGMNLVFRNNLYEELAKNSALFKDAKNEEPSKPPVLTQHYYGDIKEIKNTSVSVSNSSVMGNIVASSAIRDSFNVLESSKVSDEIKTALFKLGKSVGEMTKKLSADEKEEVEDDYKKLVDESIKKSPNKKWYSVSIEGLQKAAKNLGDVGKPVLELIAQLLVLLAQISK